jgi:hypothetical protein
LHDARNRRTIETDDCVALEAARRLVRFCCQNHPETNRKEGLSDFFPAAFTYMSKVKTCICHLARCGGYRRRAAVKFGVVLAVDNEVQQIAMRIPSLPSQQ